MIKRNNRFILIIVLIAVPFILLLAGHFLFKYWQEGVVPHFPVQTSQEPELEDNNEFPVKYIHKTEEINGYKQEINMLEIDLRSGKVEVLPVLSHNKIYGFENLSEIVLRSNAYAAVNAGFFYEYGQPAGMVVNNGEIIAKSTGVYPVFLINNGKAGLEEIKTKMFLKHQKGTLSISNINTSGKTGQTVLYTPAYGTTNRAKTGNITVTIEDNTIRKIASYKGEVDIPYNGMLLTFYGSVEYSINNLPFSIGDSVEFYYEPGLESDAQAYECGSWIVKNGQIVIGEKDAWVGVMTNRDPRTVIGIKEEGSVILMTVDGRQPGYSAGLTGKELGQLLLKYGINDAAMLDGGASTEMIVEGKIVNRPSFKGRERPLGGGIIVKIKN